jgi:predicted DNA binding CopG/RHH family protein
MTDMVKITYFIATDKAGSRCSGVEEFDRDEWEAMTDAEQEAAMREVAFEHLDWSYKEADSHE